MQENIIEIVERIAGVTLDKLEEHLASLPIHKRLKVLSKLLPYFNPLILKMPEINGKEQTG